MFIALQPYGRQGARMPAGLSFPIALLAGTASGPVDPPALNAVPDTENCKSQDVGEVVVCGPRPGTSPYRLPKVSGNFEPKPIRARAQIAPGVDASVDLESAELPGAAKSDRVMVRFKFKF